jgi:hypothetical protein
MIHEAAKLLQRFLLRRLISTGGLLLVRAGGGRLLWIVLRRTAAFPNCLSLLAREGIPHLLEPVLWPLVRHGAGVLLDIVGSATSMEGTWRQGEFRFSFLPFIPSHFDKPVAMVTSKPSCRSHLPPKFFHFCSKLLG